MRKCGKTSMLNYSSITTTTTITTLRSQAILEIDRLCVPSSSIPCERTFSKAAGYKIADRRNRLSVKNIEKLLFLNNNL
ncbi:zinc finger BED domain-containing protein DAYSLEEPER-like [Aphis craccivora]|uniref:Zinc finger BED domain-containing protein DAYSLEEPER-like n=1 Tax=Aphis craccivora TaxID=307492 RepID=A0A6G0XN17_APHCR|nr:zinc finger BED domain-containing protein DAYSLEEPER-like [Aphis craccivora]